MTSIFDEYDLEAEAAKIRSTKEYSQDLQPLEPPEPLTDRERQSIERTDSNDIFANVVVIEDGHKGEWVPPKVRQARKAAALLPKTGKIKEQEDRLFEIARHDARPKELAEAIKKARAAIATAYDVLDKARHPEGPGKARNPEAKQTAIDAIDAARVAVDNAVRVGERDDIRAEQYNAIVSGIAAAQAKAAKSAEAAARDFAHWRALIAAGHDLAVARGDFGAEWHRHKDERSINPRGMVGDLRRIRDLAKTDDPYLSGAYLIEDPTPEGEVPEWTCDALRESGEFAQNVLWRLLKQHPNDPSAADSLATRNLRPIMTAPIPALHPQSRDEFAPVLEGPLYDRD